MLENVRHELNRLNQQAIYLAQQGQYGTALTLATQVCDLARQHLGETHSDFATALNNLGELNYSIGNYIAAEPHFVHALEIRRNVLGEAHPTFVLSLNNLAELYRSMGKYKKAETLFLQALEIGHKTLGEGHPAFATTLHNLALLYRSTGNYTAAEPLCLQAMEIDRQTLGEGSEHFASSLNTVAILYHSMGRYDAAEPLLRQALDIRRRAFGENHPAFATSLHNLAELHSSIGDYGSAEPLLRQALEIRRSKLGEEHPDFAGSLHSLGVLHSLAGNHVAAEALLRQAVEIRRRVLGDDHPDLADSLGVLADVYRLTKDYAAAESLYRQALEIRLRVLGEEHPESATSVNNMALLYYSLGNYAAAEPLLRSALEIRRRVLGEEHPYYAGTLNNLAVLYSSVGNYSAAETLYRQSLEIRRKVLGEHHAEFGQSLSNLALLSVATGRPDEALMLMQQAAAIDDRMIGQIFSISSESQRIKYIDSIQGSVDGFLSLVSIHFGNDIAAIRSVLDLVLRRKGIGAEALAAQRDAVLGGKYPALESSLRELTKLRMQIAQKALAGPGAEGLVPYRARLAEWSARKEVLESELARQIPEMNLERQLRGADRLAVGQALPEGSVLVDFVRFDVFDFNAVRGRGEPQWKPARYIAFVLKAGEPDTAQMIDLGEAVVIDQMIAAFRLSITGEAESRGGRAPQPIPAPKTSQGVGLRAAVFDPLLPALGRRKRLLLAPDGDLTRLPFEVLPMDDGGRVIDEYLISYLGVARDILRFRAARRGRTTGSLVMADPDFDLGVATDPAFARAEAASIVAESNTGSSSRVLDRERTAPASPSPRVVQPARSAAQIGRHSRDLNVRTLHFERLRGTREEGEHIAEMLGTVAWLGGTALEARLKDFSSPRILHLATHGFFLPDQKRDQLREFGGPFDGSSPSRTEGSGLENPLLRSGLAFAGANTWGRGESLPLEAEDGILTAEDVSGLNLLDTELVVLSACETGLGAVHTGEGVFGLRRAFALAGAKALVMSLWKVPDEETRELMEDFYRRILYEKLPGAEALRAAQLALKNKHSDPLYWGAFIYQGDPWIAP